MSSTSSIGEAMSSIVQDVPDLSSHVVSLNRLIMELNRETRQTYMPNYARIIDIASQMKMHASLVENMMKREQK